MKKINFLIIICSILLILFAIYISFTSFLFKLSNINKNMNILIIGIDSVNFSKHSDTILLLSYNPVLKICDILSIPRDTLVYKHISINERNQKTGKNRKDIIRGMKINELFAYHYIRKNNFYDAGKEFKSEVEKILMLPISNFVILDYKGVKNIIDLVGGVQVKIVKNINYDDNWGNLHIHFTPGNYLLNGQKSIEYLRYRDDRGDLNRIMRQQEFVRNFFNKIKNPVLTFKIPMFLKIVFNNVHSDFYFSDFFFGFLEIRNISKNKIRFQLLQGIPFKIKNTEYLKVDKEKIETVRDILEHKDYKRDNAKNVITAELWNATSTPYLGRKISDLLRQYSVDVIKWGNYGYIEDKTVIYDRKGFFENAQIAGNILHCNNYVTKIDNTRLVDLTIIIGNDFDLRLVSKIK